MRRLITAGVLTGTALAALEATVVGAAMPTVVASLGGLEHYSWVFAAYLLTSTVTVPLWGKLSDLYGRRPLYQVGIALFLGGSALCGVSGTMAQLVAFRAIQGVGAGALIPLGMTILGDIYTPAERARIQGLFSGVWGLASIVGPPLGGIITEQMTWHWVFYLNIPFGLVAAAIIGFSLREPKRDVRPAIDYRGAVLLTVALSCVLIGLADARQLATLLETWRVLAFVAAAGAGAAFILAERCAVEPIVPPALMRHRVVAVSVVCGLLTGAAMFGAISYVPLYAQAAFESGATAAGATLTPLMLSWVSFSVIGGRLLLRVGFRPTVLAGQALLTTGFVLLASLGPHSARGWLYADLGVIGAGLGLTMLSMLIAVQQTVPRAQLGVATSLNQLARSLGGAVGVAVMGVILTGGIEARLPGQHDWSLLMAASGGRVLVDALRAVFVTSACMAGAAFLVAIVFWRPGDVASPSAEECSAETGERLVAAELTTLTPEQEPQARL